MESLGEHITEMHRNRLWHELGNELLLLKGEALWDNWSGIETFATKLNQITLVRIAIIAANTKSYEEAYNFSSTITATEQQAGLLLRTYRARLTLSMGNVSQAYSDFDTIQKEIESLSDLDNTIYSVLYGGLAEIHRLRNNPKLFYRYSMQYLAYTPPSDVVDGEKLAADLARAVLIAEGIFNIGELLEQSVLNSLKGTSNEWLYELLVLVNDGRVAELQEKYPTLPDELKTPLLLQKVQILALMEAVFRNNQWELTFGEIAGIMCIQHEDVSGC